MGERKSAAAVLRRLRAQLRNTVARVTGIHPYVLDQFLGEIIARCRELRLYVDRQDEQIRTEAAILLSVHTLPYLIRRERFWVRL
jgi:hypothetical protein